MSTALRSIGKYELRQRLASSHLNEVWLAQDSHSHHYVLLKVFYTHHQADSDVMRQFVSQAEAVASLRQPNLVRLLDVFVFPSRDPDSSVATMACLVTDYIEGQTLADSLRSTSSATKMRPGADIVALFTSISMAIDYAHQHGIIHGNLKPSNILLSSRTDAYDQIGEPLLTDFGFTKLLWQAASTTSPFYLSPEQIRGNPANERSDIYALGVILYELCTGVLPFRGNRPVAIMVQHLNAPPTPPALMNPTISSALAHVMLRSLAKEPEARFSSASSMTVALAMALNTPISDFLSQSSSLSEGMNEHDFSPSLPPSAQPGLTPPLMSKVSRQNGSDPTATHTNGAAGSSFRSASVSKAGRRGSFDSRYLMIMSVMLLASLGTLFLLSMHLQNTSVVAPNLLVGHAYLSSNIFIDPLDKGSEQAVDLLR